MVGEVEELGQQEEVEEEEVKKEVKVNEEVKEDVKVEEEKVEEVEVEEVEEVEVEEVEEEVGGVKQVRFSRRPGPGSLCSRRCVEPLHRVRGKAAITMCS